MTMRENGGQRSGYSGRIGYRDEAYFLIWNRNGNVFVFVFVFGKKKKREGISKGRFERCNKGTKLRHDPIVVFGFLGNRR